MSGAGIGNPKAVIAESNGGLPVNLQDQTTPTIILPMVQQLGATIITVDTVINAYTMTVDDATGFVVGQHIRIINSAADRFYYGTITGIAALVITVDTQFDFVFVAGSEVTISNINMNVNGAVTPVIFKLRTGTPSIPSNVDITRIIMVCEATSAVDLSLFGNLGALGRGLAFRRIDGIQLNIFNVKTNFDIAGLMYDWTPFAATNPSQGVDGFAARMTFAGQNKIGVTLRVDAAGNLEMLVQDDLTLLTKLNVIVEGHIVTD